MVAPSKALQKPYRDVAGSGPKVPRYPKCPHCPGEQTIYRLYFQVPVTEKGKTKYTTDKTKYRICPRCERVYTEKVGEADVE